MRGKKSEQIVIQKMIRYCNEIAQIFFNILCENDMRE